MRWVVLLILVVLFGTATYGWVTAGYPWLKHQQQQRYELNNKRIP